MNPFIKTSAGLFVTASLDKPPSGLGKRIVAALAAKLQTEQKTTVDPALWHTAVSNIPDLVQSGSRSTRKTAVSGGETTAAAIATMMATLVSPASLTSKLERAVSDYLKPLEGIDSFVLVAVIEDTNQIEIIEAQVTVNLSAQNQVLALDTSSYSLNLGDQKVRTQLGSVFDAFDPLSGAPYAIDIGP